MNSIMKKGYLFCSFFFLFAISGYAQKDDNGMTLVLVINDKMVSEPISVKILKKFDSHTEVLSANYWPGKLSVTESDYKKILDARVDSIFIRIDDNRYAGDNYFDVRLAKSRFRDHFTILYIYNLNNKKYRGVFSNIPKDKNYVYEIRSSSGGVLLARNKK